MARAASLAIALALAVAVSLASARPAHAANLTFAVNNLTDAHRAAGAARTTCDSTIGAGVCTLRAAIEEAVLPAHAGDVITVTLIVGNYPLTLGVLPDITIGLAITGPDASTTSVDGLSAVRVFTIGAGTTVSITGVALQHGSANGGGGILNNGTLTLNQSRVNLNSTTGPLGGGGIRNLGTMTLNNSQVNSNTASGGAGTFGGGIYSQGPLTLNSSTVSSNTNTAGAGGGVFNFGSNLTISRSTISANTATGAAGISDGGTLSIADSIVSGNTGDVGGIQSSGSFSIVRSTISGNTSPTAFGGAMDVSGGGSLVNVTISGNTAPSGAALVSSSEGGVTMTNVTIANNTSTTLAGAITNFGGGLTLLNTIVANNPGGNCRDPIATATYSLDSGTTCGFTGTGDLSSTNPNLGALADNGGPTPTQALPAGSPAIDAGINAGCPATDQRGITRPQGPRCDIGAYEYVPVVPTPTPTPPGLPNTGARAAAQPPLDVLVLLALLVAVSTLTAAWTLRRT